MFSALGRLTSRYPRYVLAVWGLLLLVSAPFAGRVGEVLTTDAGVAPGSQAQAVRLALVREFTGNNNHQLLLVADAEAAPAGERARYGARLAALIDEIAALPEVARVIDSRSESPLPIPALSETAGSSLALITLTSPNKAAAGAAARRIHALLAEAQTGDLELFLTGGVALEREINEISKRDTLRAELVGLPISLIVLAVAFGALVAASLPLLVALLSVTLSFAALYLLGQIFSFATFAQVVVTMLGLATGIDYALLMVNRYREELTRTADPRLAAVATTQTAGKAVTVSGVTVLVALTALLVPPLRFVQSIGVASLTVMLFSVLVSVTALPAVLTLLGPRVNALRLTRLVPGRRSRGFWRARASMVTRRPWRWTLVGIGVLLLLALPALQMRVAFSGVDGLTEETDTRRAQTVLETLGFDSLLRSFEVLIDFGERGFFHPASVRAVSEFSRAAEDLVRVAQTLTPTTAGGLPYLMLAGYYADRETAQASPLGELVGTTVSEDGRYALARIFPVSGTTPAQARRIEARLHALAQEQDLEVLVGGSFVNEREWAEALYRSFPWAVGLVYLVTFVLLGLAFRSLLIPLKSILLNTLIVAAAFGVITAVFQKGWGAHLFGVAGGLGFVESSVPIFIFAIVFGLSMDYEVFLVTRIVENHRRGLSDREAVIEAVEATGGVITSAALIMSVVFSVFLFSHVVFIKTLSLGLTVAVLLDATLVRLALVPAVTLLAGRWNWWLPRLVERLARQVDVGHD